MLVDGHLRGLTDEQRVPVGLGAGDALGGDGPLAPARFSTTTERPKAAESFWARMRATTSPVPPGA
jgi:hypothetical protein